MIRNYHLITVLFTYCQFLVNYLKNMCSRLYYFLKKYNALFKRKFRFGNNRSTNHVLNTLAELMKKHYFREKCPYSEFFWSVFIHIRTDYRDVFSPNAGKYGPEKLRIRTLFTQWYFSIKKKSLSTHFMLLISFYTPWKQ